jgi:uncharacterized protein (UPF0548 family)
MLSVRKPCVESIRIYIAAQSKLGFTYTGVGTTATTPAAGNGFDHARVRLGDGAATYQAACRALAQWKQFSLGWVEVCPPDAPLREGETVAVLIRAFGLWWLNAARIVYVIDESSPSVTRFGFAYGTLPGHVEAGEERFLIDWEHADDSVFYEILAFSRPRHLLTRIGQWQVRRMQQRFRDDSAAAMRRAVERTD